jgi:tRNA (guanine-N7-)-methyltransferase
MADATSTAVTTAAAKGPQKKFYRSRAHCNPLSHNDSFE